MSNTLAQVKTADLGFPIEVIEKAAMLALHENAPGLVKTLIKLIQVGESDKQIIARCREAKPTFELMRQIENTLPALRRFLP